MPLHAAGWTSKEDEKLAELVQPHSYLYNHLDPSRKNILAREVTWQEIGKALCKPVEDCKKRWRGLRDSYMRSKRLGAIHRTKADLNDKLQFLDTLVTMDSSDEVLEDPMMEETTETIVGDEQVVMENQDYYEITVVDNPQEAPDMKPFIKILPKGDIGPKRKKHGGRKKTTPMPRNLPPVKILPKPILMNGPKILSFVEDQKTPEQRSQVIDKLVEKILMENTNEIDVFFRSMAQSVKKLQPNLIPKVKMEVCNVIAKYEMQSFDRHTQ